MSSLSEHGALMSFFKFYHEKPPAVMHMIGQKTSILSKLRSIMGQKSQYDALFSELSRKNQ